jgi:hypothetical protein
MSEISDDDARVAIAIRDDDDDDDDDGRGRTRRRDDARFGGAARTTRGEEEDADDEEDAPAAARTRAVSGAMAAVEAMARGRRGARAMRVWLRTDDDGSTTSRQLDGWS